MVAEKVKKFVRIMIALIENIGHKKTVQESKR
jgi:hypothetical protein